MYRTLLLLIATIASIPLAAQTASGYAIVDSVAEDVLSLFSPLHLNEVTVTAQRSKELSSAYVVDRTTIEHAQAVNVSDIAALLPGGKTPTGNNNLASADNRIQLRSESSENGNISFGTAVEIDGIRLDNNFNALETASPDTRSVSTTNIAAVEVITGIPSVEYGDISNGVVKIKTLSGKTPWLIDGAVSPNTKQVAVSKGVTLARGGAINASYDFTRSVADIASPYKSYTRNTLTLKYSGERQSEHGRLAYDATLTGNVGGMNTVADPDAFTDTYTRAHDNTLRVGLHARWFVDAPWLTSLEANASGQWTDKHSRTKSNESSASVQPQIHTMTDGYFVGSTYDDDPNANIILGETGYWYQTSINDNKPHTYAAKLKASLIKTGESLTNNIMVGVEWTRSSNTGQGQYYTDMRYAPTWREYRYADRPAMNNIAIYIEDKMRVGELDVMAGLREDVTVVAGSDYGTVASLSPRINVRYEIVRGVSVFAGTGKAVKLPSFSVLNPRPSYDDILAFTSSALSDGSTYYAYYTQTRREQYNKDLKWQYTHQSEVGAEARVGSASFSVTAYLNKTYRPYMQLRSYEAFDYLYTSLEEAEKVTIAAENRTYSIDESTGVVTAHDITGEMADEVIGSTTRKKYTYNTYYANGSPITRMGIEWVADMPRIKPIHTTVRIDGNLYHYYALDNTLVAWCPTSRVTSAGDYFPYVGYYTGTGNVSVPDAETENSIATVANGKRSNKLNLNLTAVTHIPSLRLVVSAKLEATLMTHTRYLCENGDGSARGYAAETSTDYSADVEYTGQDDRYVVVYPTYYSTIDDPETLISFREMFEWAKENDSSLYTDLKSLVVKTTTAYYMNEKHISPYCTANLRVTKEIGNHVDFSFYATNFFNNTSKITESDSNSETTLYGSTYIPAFYYGLSLKVKL